MHTKAYAVLSVRDLRRMIRHIIDNSRPHMNGGKRDFGPCTGVFRTTVSEKIDQDGDRQIESYSLSHPEFDTFRQQRNAQMGDAVRESLKCSS